MHQQKNIPIAKSKTVKRYMLETGRLKGSILILYEMYDHKDYSTYSLYESLCSNQIQ